MGTEKVSRPTYKTYSGLKLITLYSERKYLVDNNNKINFINPSGVAKRVPGEVTMRVYIKICRQEIYTSSEFPIAWRLSSVILATILITLLRNTAWFKVFSCKVSLRNRFYIWNFVSPGIGRNDFCNRITVEPRLTDLKGGVISVNIIVRIIHRKQSWLLKS